MLLFVAALIIATCASGVWCTAEIVPHRARAWWRAGRPGTASAVVLIAVVCLAAGLRFLFVPPHNAMYLDEPWYAEAACNLARFGRLVICEDTWSGTACVPYGKALGWPMLIAPWTMLVGCGSYIGINLNRVLGVATVVLVALATRCAGGKWWQGAVAAAILAIHPVHVVWSATGETNVAAAATLLVGLCGALLYVRTGRCCGAVLAVSGLGLSTAIRPESLVPAVVSGVVLAVLARTKLRPRLLVASGIGVVCAAAAGSGTQLWTMNESISGGAFLSLRNIAPNALFVARAGSLPIHGMVVLMAIGGAVMMARSHQRRAAWLLLSTAVAGAFVVLSYDRFHERMLLGATVCLLPLSGFLFDWLSIATAKRGRSVRRPLAATAFFSLLVVLWGHDLRSASVPPETQVLETRIASHVARLPFAADSLFITEQPPVVAAAGLTHVMATERALEHEEQLSQVLDAGRPVYFLCDMYCESGFQGDATPPRCSRMLAHFALSPVVEETLNSRTYILYRVAGPTAGSAPPPQCPIARRPTLD